ncbi:MAG: tRNA pseudouridine(13) synthase TruD, partial [Nanoarchaeota archaeon]|nr:tRNA pseudouridine(13) synthase TruD [Nanoarchaeota archaeon]
ITSQYISVEKKINFEINDVEFELKGRGKKRIYMGKLEGNEFIITIRDLDKKLNLPEEVINLFGEQRFSNKNDKLGKLLVQKKFKEVCEELELKVEKNDYIGALRKFGKAKLRFFINAYQSYLWNKIAKVSNQRIVPIIGFLTEEEDYDELLEKEGVSKLDFILREMPELVAEGSERERVMKVKNFKSISFEDDELNKGKKKQVVSFFLPKGSYATVVMDNLK